MGCLDYTGRGAYNNIHLLYWEVNDGAWLSDPHLRTLHVLTDQCHHHLLPSFRNPLSHIFMNSKSPTYPYPKLLPSQVRGKYSCSKLTFRAHILRPIQVHGLRGLSWNLSRQDAVGLGYHGQTRELTFPSERPPTLHIVDVEFDIIDEATTGYWYWEWNIVARSSDQVD
jgi:hypothetical protein